MPYRPHPSGTTTNPGDGPWSACDRCGRLYSGNRLQFQYDFMGGNVPQNLGLLVCSKSCLDELNWQQKLLILPPDPPPFFNTRPENYAVDETNWLTTQDGDVITTQGDSPIVTPIPNPDSPADATYLTAVLAYSGGSISVAYLDLFIGDPSGADFYSVLEAITGSATRTDVASSLTINSENVAANPDTITVSSSSASTTSVEYVGIYDAASGGNLLVSGPVSATFPTVQLGAIVQFNALGLSIDLN